ncbi:ABC transporter permease [Olivibacter domesticus]|uniref:MacB-like core domain-containing protein n=1 Tax=Olivibacter domesticus TaxID=407022 RepID=A0A1H7SE97_OLID1|nr:ABC transporter permease [Olivibacter domesticus]SEL70718.1 MacB-like core domain-containing protein [Olivibacter domesticus]
MFQNYIKIAWRSLIKNRLHTVINIAGLSTGLTVTLLISLWVRDELTFDRQHPNYQNIAQVMINTQQNGILETSKTVAAPLAEALRSNYRDAFKSVVLARQAGDHLLHYEDKTLRATGKFVEKEGTNILPLQILNGKRDGLIKPNSIMLSQEMSQAIFGETDPIGKTLKVDDNMLVSVTGVYKDLPNNSTFKEVKYLIPWSLLAAVDKNYSKLEKSWEFNWFEIFIELNPQISMSSVSKEIKDLQKNILKDNTPLSTYSPSLFLHPMEKWHLYGDWKDGKNTGGLITFVWLFSIIGFFVLLLAAVNFINLSTAKAQKRAKEVGIRKAIGSNRKQLMLQFFCESVLTTFLSYLLALALAYFSLPFFNDLSVKSLYIPYTDLNFLLISIGFVLLIGLLSGAYPALLLSSFNAINTLRGLFSTSKKMVTPRQVLVVIQFTIATILSIGTIIIFQQIQHAKNRQLGYNQKDLISFRMSNFNGRNEAFRNNLLQTGVLSDVAQTTSPATDNWSNASGFFWEGKNSTFKDNFSLVAVSPDYGKTLEWKMMAGRDFSKDFVSDSSSVILNESAIRYMGIKEPIGKTIRWKDETFSDASYTIIGVVKDLVSQSPYEPVYQTIYFMQPAANFLLARLKPGINTQDALTKIKTVFNKYAPDEAFEFSFVKDDFTQKFSFEERVGKLALILTLLTLLISCMGIFGLVTFMAEQRKKEIGIRKVLGANIQSLTQLLSFEFVKLVIISTLIAIPFAWWLTNKWLENFSLKITISWWTFAYTSLAILLVALFTISFQTVKTALANPADSLRNE